MKKILYLSVLIAAKAYSQQGNTNLTNTTTNKESLFMRDGYRVKLETEGSPYLYSEFKKAKIANNSKIYDMRYNAYKDEVEIINNGKVMTIFKNSDYSPIVILDPDETIVLKDFVLKGQKVKGYLFQAKRLKDYTFYMRVAKEYNKGKYADSSFDKNQPESYTDMPEVFFIQKGENELVELPNTKKKLLEMFPDKKDAIELNLKSNKIDTKDLATLSRLFAAFS